MSSIFVFKQNERPHGQCVAKYRAPQTGPALLKSLKQRLGKGDLEDAEGYSITKASTSVAAGDYFFLPGISQGLDRTFGSVQHTA